MSARRTVLALSPGLLVLVLVLSTRAAFAEKKTAGRKLAFLVGVKQYDHDDLKDLAFPEDDVNELAAVLKPQGFETVVLTTTAGKTDPKNKPTAQNIRTRLKTLLQGATKRDLIIVGLAGHGIQPLGSHDSFFCPMDANPVVRNDKPIEPQRLVSIGEILAQMADSGIGEKLLMMDACRNDPSARSARRRGIDHVNTAALPSRTGVLLSCSPGEFSFEEKSLGKGHGVFFYHVIEGLNGKAKDDDGEVTWDSLGAYVRRKVPTTVEKLFGKDGGEQSPNAIGNLRGAPTILAIARITALSKTEKPTPSVPSTVMPEPNEPGPETPGTFGGSRTGQVHDDNGIKTQLVWIPAGRFRMGSPKNEEGRYGADEDQVHVTLTKGFWLGQHEVTQAEWWQVMRTTPWSGKDKAKEGNNYPATYVSWDDAIRFCEKLSEKERADGRLPSGWQFTLPTEAQWEFACRAGTTSRFSFGDAESELGEYAWFYSNANDVHEVRTKKANPWGLSDMHGNVFEWCRDWRAKKPAGGTDPQGPSEGSLRVFRGGSWSLYASFCRSAMRRGGKPGYRDKDLGFRVALTPSAK